MALVLEVKKFVSHQWTVSANVVMVAVGKPLVELYLWFREHSVRLKCSL